MRQALAMPLFCCLLLPTGQARALDCPPIPAQASKDWELEVRAAVGRIGPAKGPELQTRARGVTRDLLGRLPQADRVYLEQMMYATYCSALRDDPTLSEAQRRERIRAYNLEVRKVLHPTAARTAATPQLSAKDAARRDLERIPLPYTPEAFLDSARKGDLRAVQLFLAAGMDPNAQADQGNTALIHAAGAGQVEVMAALLKARANVNQRNWGGKGRSALAWAAAGGHLEAMRLLLDRGADTGSIGQAVLDAAASGQAEALRLLVKRGADRRLASQALLSAAQAADSPGMPETVRLLVGLGADPNARDEAGRTALLHGLRHGWAEPALRALLAAGADIKAGDEEGWTALLEEAASQARPAILGLLLEAGADVDARCACPGYRGGGWNALMMAAKDSDGMPMAELLLARGARPNLANADGNTPLMIAADHPDNIELARVLLDRGAEVDARNAAGETALMLASGQDLPLVRLLLQRGADVRLRDRQGSDALIRAAATGQTAIIEALLDAGADLHARNARGQTALMRAVRWGWTDAVLTLLRRGARVNDEDAYGKTPLNFAEEDLKDPQRTEMIRILKKAGAQ